MWLALTTRPDILHSVSKLAHRNQNPHAEHMAGIKHILRYLSSTVDVKLHYQQCGQSFCGYVDANWAGDRLARKSYTGYIYLLADGPISWRSEQQRSVALSSTEAEYMALSAAFKDAIVM
ncbi:secreted RxLR effector protein 161-like [Drosophila teissieri]|uniref:secreted RxLR effector protein 161-like n=1 Tax=Drosophila teissieri TaxID=7243 RepID=UPI001CBA3800|nr:secreted RxLR effector protein 161-like [Drosophila teissieri]XP_043661685.1 secreted RxLR effector protein 161-like [Drosophila teissieri]